MKCEVNFFRLKLNPQKAYIKEVLIDKKDTFASLRKKAYKQDAIFYNNKFISYKQQEGFKESYFRLLDEYSQTQLLQLFLKKERKIFNILSQNTPNLDLKDYTIIRSLIGQIFKLNNNFFISLDIKQTIFPKKTLLENLKPDFIGKEVITGDKSIGIIKSITFLEDKFYDEKLETISKFRKDLKKEPIIGIEFKNSSFKQEYYYFASDLRLYYSVKDIDINLVISNEERKKIIQDAIKKSNISYIDTNCLAVNYFPFKFVEFNGFEKKVNFINKLLIKKDNFNTIYPKRIPNILKNETINILILIDNNIQLSQNDYINRLYKGLKEITKSFPVDFKLKNKNDYFIEFLPEDIVKKVLEYKTDSLIPFLVIMIGDKKKNYYEDVKRKLFKLGFITQNILYENLLKAKEYEINNLILQILVKYGMYPYTLNIKHKYDYILGIDVGNDLYGNRNTAGGISVINKKGFLEKLIPIKIPTNGEKIDLSLFLEEVSIHLKDLQNKNLLILRDGKLTQSEKESILKEFNRLKLKSVTFMNIVKRHNLRIYDEIGNKGVILKDNLALLLAHSIKGARSIKINVKSVVNDFGIKDEVITKEDLELLFNLTNLNYSNIYIKSKRLRLPAPIHYSDKFVKALGKGWEIKDIFLENGFLYFL